MKIDKYSFPFPEEDFPFRIDIDTARDYIKCSRLYHLHPLALELQYIRSGEGSYFIKNRRYVLNNKSLLIIHGHDIHSYIKAESSSLIDKISLTFSNALFKNLPPGIQSLIKGITACRQNFPHQICFNEKEATEVELLINMLREEWRERGIYYREAIVNGLIRFLIIIKRVMSRKIKPNSSEEHHPLIDKIIAHIDIHFKEPLTLSLASECVYRSPHHISHLFKKFTGFGFRAYLANKRVIEAKRILGTDDTKIISVALEAGFSDLSTFNRNFKRLTGMSPSQYRKLYPH